MCLHVFWRCVLYVDMHDLKKHSEFIHVHSRHLLHGKLLTYMVYAYYCIWLCMSCLCIQRYLRKVRTEAMRNAFKRCCSHIRITINISGCFEYCHTMLKATCCLRAKRLHIYNVFEKETIMAGTASIRISVGDASSRLLLREKFIKIVIESAKEKSKCIFEN